MVYLRTNHVALMFDASSGEDHGQVPVAVPRSIAHAAAEDNEGVARELARKDLPLSTFTEAYWKCDLHNLLHFLSLRLDAHAQLEIRAFAQAIAFIVQFWVPWTWEAFVDHRLYGMCLSRREIEVMRDLLEVKEEINQVLQGELDMTKREMAAFKGKVKQLMGE